ncbi:MAG TPA: hypothetical protein VG966_03835 [Hyphomicrobiaceae bacterium]|nr:hypothetical protein [Hyphomicrobiaceae bacterium]
MLVHRGIGALTDAGRMITEDAQESVQIPAQQLLEPNVSAGSSDLDMKIVVPRAIHVNAADAFLLDLLGEFGDALTKVACLGERHALGGLPACNALQGFSDDEQLLEVLDRELDDADSGERGPLDEPPSFERTHGLAQRAAAHAAKLRQRLLRQSRTGSQLAAQDRAFQPRNCLIDIHVLPSGSISHCRHCIRIVDRLVWVWGRIASAYVGNAILLALNIPLVGIFVNLLRIPFQISLRLFSWSRSLLRVCS